MIGEGIDTVLTVARALAGWIVVAGVVAAVLVVAAAVTGAWAVRGTWEWLYARLRPEVPAKAHRLLGVRERPAQGRLWPRAARASRTEAPTTGPSRPHSPRWSASGPE